MEILEYINNENETPTNYLTEILALECVDLHTIPYIEKVYINENFDENLSIIKYIIKKGTIHKRSTDKNENLFNETKIVIKWAIFDSFGRYLDCSVPEGEEYQIGVASPDYRINLMSFMRALFSAKLNEISWIRIPSECIIAFPGLEVDFPTDNEIWICIDVIKIYNNFYTQCQSYTSFEFLLEDCDLLIADAQLLYDLNNYKKALTKFEHSKTKLTNESLILTHTQINEKKNKLFEIIIKILKCHFNLKNFIAIKQITEQYINDFPNEPHLRFFSAVAHKELFYMSDALFNINFAIKIKPNYKVYHKLKQQILAYKKKNPNLKENDIYRHFLN